MFYRVWNDILFFWAGLFETELVNAKPGLKVNRSNNFSSIEMFFAADVLRSLGILKLKTEGQKIQTENVTENVQK